MKNKETITDKIGIEEKENGIYMVVRKQRIT